MFKTAGTWGRATKKAAEKAANQLPYADDRYDVVEEHINDVLSASKFINYAKSGDFAAVAPHNDDVIGYVGIFNADESGNQRTNEDMKNSITESIEFIAKRAPVSVTDTAAVSIAVSVDYSWYGEHMTVEIPLNERGEIDGEVSVYRPLQGGAAIGVATCHDASSVAATVLSAYYQAAYFSFTA